MACVGQDNNYCTQEKFMCTPFHQLYRYFRFLTFSQGTPLPCNGGWAFISMWLWTA